MGKMTRSGGGGWVTRIRNTNMTYDICTGIEKLKWGRGFEVNLSIKCERRRPGRAPTSLPSSHPDTVPEDGRTPRLSKQVQGVTTAPTTSQEGNGILTSVKK